MQVPHRLVVFDALMFKAYASYDADSFPDEIDAIQVPFRRRQLRMLLTDGILAEYQREANREPQFQLLPLVNDLSDRGVVIRMDEYRIRRFPVQIAGLPNWHQVFIRDAVGAAAEYLITNRTRWLDIAEQSARTYGLHILTPARFVELEG